MTNMKIPGTQYTLHHQPVTVSYELTQVGREKAEQYAVGGPELAVLLALEQHQRMTVQEVAAVAHVEIGVAKGILNRFANAGWVRRVQVPSA